MLLHPPWWVACRIIPRRALFILPVPQLHTNVKRVLQLGYWWSSHDYHQPNRRTNPSLPAFVNPSRNHAVTTIRLGHHGGGGGSLVAPSGGQDADGLVVAGKTVDTRLDQNQAELGVLVLTVALKVLADGDGLWGWRLVDRNPSETKRDKVVMVAGGENTRAQ